VEDSVECIESVLVSEGPSSRVVVLDNGSKNDESLVLKKRFGESIDVLRSIKNLGVAAGWNMVISYSWEKYRPAHFFILIDDMIVDRTAIKELRDFLLSRDDAGVAGLPIARLGSPDEFEDGRFNDLQEPTVDYLLLGGAMLIRSEIFEALGMFDEEFFIHGEENDFMDRMRRSRWKPYLVPTHAKVYHKGKPSASGVSGFAAFHRTRNMLVLLRKDYAGVRLAKSLVRYFLRWLPMEMTKDIAHSGGFRNLKARGRGLASGMAFLIRNGRGNRHLRRLGDGTFPEGVSEV